MSIMTSQKIKIEELELLSSEPEIANQKCEKCSFVAKDSKILKKHMKQAHGQGKKCKYCPEISEDETRLRKHIEKQHSYVFTCEVCTAKFKTLYDAREHAKKPCGSIKPREVVINIDVDDTNRCNACSISFSNNTNLENHMEKEHNV